MINEINTLDEMTKQFHKDREIEFKQAKEKISFTLRGKTKYYYAFQCALFEKNIIKYGYDCYATSKSVANEGLIFSEYKISLGHPHGYHLKTFDNKAEMLGFVIGFNECIASLEHNSAIN